LKKKNRKIFIYPNLEISILHLKRKKAMKEGKGQKSYLVLRVLVEKFLVALRIVV
jgi:hypothetical protein